MKYDPIRELNKENERRMTWPPVLLTLGVLVGTPLALVAIFHFRDFIDAYTQKHSLVVGYSCVAICAVGWYYLGRFNRMW